MARKLALYSNRQRASNSVYIMTLIVLDSERSMFLLQIAIISTTLSCQHAGHMYQEYFFLLTEGIHIEAEIASMAQPSAFS